MQVYAVSIPTPTPWRAGFYGDGVPFYFDCAGCGQPEPPIAGYLATRDSWVGAIAIIRRPDGFYSNAMYCGRCWPGIVGVQPCS